MITDVAANPSAGEADVPAARIPAGGDSPGLRRYVRQPPKGRQRLKWYTPAVLWAVSSIGSGSVLFTPRIAARYEYALAWVAVITCVFMWVLIREAARYSIVTGKTLLDGFSRLPGPRHWALWVIFVPQLLAAAVGVAGLSALVGSALSAGLGGPNPAWTLGFLALSTGIVTLGGYDGVRRISTLMGILLVGLSIIAAATIVKQPAQIAAGLVPQVPADFDAGFILPWVGTILAGSMGIIWFSYWTATHGYGGPSALSGEHTEKDGEAGGISPVETRLADLASWLRLSDRAALVAVLMGALVIFSFLVLGTRLLAPQGDIPAGPDVARELAQLFGDVWGRSGFAAMLVLAIFALGGSVIANQDGWGRSFADITLLLWPAPARPTWMTRRRSQRLYVVTVTGLVPAAIYLAVRDPVAIMSVSGAVAAFHTPLIAALILWTNRRQLPAGLRPHAVSALFLGAAGLYYLGASLTRLAAG